MGKFIKDLIPNVIFGLIILVILIGGIVGAVSSIETSAYESYAGYTPVTYLGEYVIKTDEGEDESMPALTASQLQTVIDTNYTGESHDNYIQWTDYFIEMQDKYKVNAAFALAVAEQNKDVTEESYNIFGIKDNSGNYESYDSYEEAIVEGFGKYIKENYFDKGKYKIDDVGTNIISSSSKSEIKNTLTDDYTAAGVSMAAPGGVYENGVYTYAGRRYTLFNQHNYPDTSYAGGSISSHGCGATSVAIIVSAYKSGETPVSIVKNCEPKYGNTVNPIRGYGNPNGVFHKFLGEYGLTCTHYEGVNLDNIVQHLKSGKPVIFNYQYGTLRCIDGSSLYVEGHFVTFLGLDDSGNIFVGDPAGCAVGYATLDSIRNCGGVRYFLVTEK